jgi:hypothetical protein
MNKYNNSKIYAIKSNQTDKIYIGSTCLDIYERLRKHRQNFRYYNLNGIKYTTSYEILKFEDHFIVLLENVNCKNQNELFLKESQYINENINHCVNRIINYNGI